MLSFVQKQYEDQLASLRKQIEEKDSLIEEKEEENYSLNEQLINKQVFEGITSEPYVYGCKFTFVFPPLVKNWLFYSQEQLMQEADEIKEALAHKDEEIRKLRQQLQVGQEPDELQHALLVQRLQVRGRDLLNHVDVAAVAIDLPAPAGISDLRSNRTPSFSQKAGTHFCQGLLPPRPQWALLPVQKTHVRLLALSSIADS